jgi:SAM-dependent methyltransferase
VGESESTEMTQEIPSQCADQGVDFGRAASDYARHRVGFPDSFFQRLLVAGWVKPADEVLDLGAGTGAVARGLATRGCKVTGLDPSVAMLEQARLLDREVGVEIQYVTGNAENTGLPARTFAAVTAGQCWHWFDRPKAALEVRRMLTAGGRLIIAHFDWLPLPGNVVQATEHLIHEHNPPWDGDDGTGIHPLWFGDLSHAGFLDIESFTFDVSVSYSHEAWLGRIRASSGVGASLTRAAVERFNDAHRELLARNFPDDPLQIPHRVFAVSGKAPE